MKECLEKNSHYQMISIPMMMLIRVVLLLRESLMVFISILLDVFQFDDNSFEITRTGIAWDDDKDIYKQTDKKKWQDINGTLFTNPRSFHGMDEDSGITNLQKTVWETRR